MPYKIELSPSALKQLKKMDNGVKNRIKTQLLKIQSLSNPRDLGKALQGEFSHYWVYRVGNYRLITKIEDKKLLLLLVKIMHRSTVYK